MKTEEDCCNNEDEADIVDLIIDCTNCVVWCATISKEIKRYEKVERE
jgi:hypothetical protein